MVSREIKIYSDLHGQVGGGVKGGDLDVEVVGLCVVNRN